MALEATMESAVGGGDVPPGVELRHLAVTIGTEVHGLDLSRDLDPATLSWLKRLFLERKALLFPGQELTTEDHQRVAAYFGPPPTTPDVKFASGSREEKSSGLHTFVRGKGNQGRENHWHQDHAYANPPVAGKIAIIRELPDLGGETVFADMAAAYEGLSPWVKKAIADLKAEHGFSARIRDHHPGLTDEELASWAAAYPSRILPVVQTHPETGQKILYVSRSFTLSIPGLPTDEAAMLIDFLARQVTVPEYQCRFRWTKNAVGMWDNRAVQHYACYDYAGQERVLQGIFFLSERPWPGVD